MCRKAQAAVNGNLSISQSCGVGLTCSTCAARSVAVTPLRSMVCWISLRAKRTCRRLCSAKHSTWAASARLCGWPECFSLADALCAATRAEQTSSLRRCADFHEQPGSLVAGYPGIQGPPRTRRHHGLQPRARQPEAIGQLARTSNSRSVTRMGRPAGPEQSKRRRGPLLGHD